MVRLRLSAALGTGLLVACGSSTKSPLASASHPLGADVASPVEPEAARVRHPEISVDPERSDRQRSGLSQPAPDPIPTGDPALVDTLLAQSASPVDGRTRLGLRLAVVEYGPDTPWHVAVVNRGSQALRVLFDLRTLSLAIEAPPIESAQSKSRAAKSTKPLICALPKELVPTREAPEFELSLAPGEALVHPFDPRLYCAPTQVERHFVPGARVTVRLGFPEKTKTVWRKGRAEKQRVEQSPPFLAHLVNTPEPSFAGRRSPEKADNPDGLEGEPGAVKELVAPTLELGGEYASGSRKERNLGPLSLQLVKGSDARTARDVTLRMQLVNQSPRTVTVYFRRELVSFEVAGPSGITGCDAGPDQRAPERLGYSSLASGAKLTATSRLIELCPDGTWASPGLYLVHARFESQRTGEEFGYRAFAGRVVSDSPALVRVRTGTGSLVRQHDPMRVRVGPGLVEAGKSP